VAGSVGQLDPKDVVISDADGNRALSGGDSQNPDGDTLQQQLTKRLMATLAPVVGNDRIHATVNVEYETASSEQNEEKYDPAVSAVLNMQRSEEGGTAGPRGVPGTSSNVPAAKTTTATTAGSPGPTSTTESATYGVNKITRHEIDPAGGIRRITAAIVLDDAVERQQKNGKWVSVRQKISDGELKTITSLAEAAVGFDAARGDVVSVQNLSFDRAGDSDLAPDTWMDRTRQQLTKNSSLVAYAGLVVLLIAVYFVMFRPMQKRVWAAPAPLEITPGPEALTLPVETTTEHSNEVPSRIAAQRSLELKNELAEFIKSDPEAGTSAIRSWLREEA
jgi:flagellar M-ring protein FliF